MKIDSVYEIERTASFKGENEFSMKMTGKAFDIMTAGLYSDRIGSTVRELSTNASDSHINAKKAHVPFRISVPTVLDPHFVVYDEGTGMSPEQIKTHFVTLFDSSKDTSNDQVGAFGLGSKTPFSLTDTYTVEGRWNGMKHLFVMFKNERRVPAILETGAFPTDEPNGITIKVPVPADNYDKFIKAIKNQLHLFDPKPIIDNVDDFEWHDTPVMTEIMNTKFYVHDKWNSEFALAKFSVSMGKIIYPVDLQQMDSELKERMKRITSNSITRFEIGDLDLQPSREGLSYDDATKYMLNTYYTAMLHEYDMKVIEGVHKAPNLFTAWKLFQGYRSADEYWKNYPMPILYDKVDVRDASISMPLPKLEYKEKTLDRNLYAFDCEQAREAAFARGEVAEKAEIDPIKHYQEVKRVTPAFYYRDVRIQQADPIWSEGTNWGVVSFREMDNLQNSGTTDKTYILMDNDKNIRRKVKQYLIAKGFRNVRVIYVQEAPPAATDVKSLGFSDLKAAFSEHFPAFADRCILLSEIENPKIDRGPKLDGRIEGVRLLTNPYHTKTAAGTRGEYRGYFTKTLGEVSEHSPYVLMEGKYLAEHGGDPKSSGLEGLFNGIGVQLYGILKGGMQELPKIKAVGGVEVMDWIAGVLEDYWLDDEVAIHFGLAHLFKGETEYYEEKWTKTLLAHFPDNSYLTSSSWYFKAQQRGGSFYSVFERKMSPQEQLIEWIIVNKHCERFKQLPAIQKYQQLTFKNDGAREAFIKRYPLVHGLLSLGYSWDMVPHVVSYMNMVDNQGQI